MAAKTRNLSIVESIVRGGVWISLWGGILLWLFHMNFFTYDAWDYEWAQFIVYGLLALSSITALLYLFRKRGANTTAIIWSILAVASSGIFVLLVVTDEIFPETYLTVMVGTVGAAGAAYIGFMIISGIIKGIIMGVIKTVRGGEERKNGHSKQCPYCGHYAKLDAEICPHCQTHFPLEKERKELIGKLVDTGAPVQTRMDALRSLSTLHLLDITTCLRMLRYEIRTPERRPHLCAELLMALRDVDARQAARLAKSLKRHRIPVIRRAAADVLSEDYSSETAFRNGLPLPPFLQVLFGTAALVAIGYLLTVSIILPSPPKAPELRPLPESGIEKVSFKYQGERYSTWYMSGFIPGKDFIWLGRIPYIWQGEEEIDYNFYTREEGKYLFSINGKTRILLNQNKEFDVPLTDTLAQVYLMMPNGEGGHRTFLYTIMSRDEDNLLYYHERILESTASIPELNSPHLKVLSIRDTEIYEYDPLGEIVKGKTEGLRILNLISSEVSDDEFCNLSRMPDLRALTLDGTKITGRGIKYLYDIPHLRTLGLTNSLLGLGNLRHIANLVNLRILNLTSSYVWNGQLRYISGLSELRILDLRGNLITDNGLKHLIGLENLRSLDLSDTYITDQGLKQLSRLTGLQSLHLEYLQLDGEGLAWLGGLKNLKILDLSNGYLYDGNILWIAELKELEVLDLGTNSIGYDGIKEVVKLKKLKKLYLQNNELNNEVITLLYQLPELEVLNISHFHKTFDIEALIKLNILPELKHLYLDGFQVEELSPYNLKRLKRALPGCTIYSDGEPLII